MDLKISDLSAPSTYIQADIAHFQVMVMDLDQFLMTVKDHIVALPVQDTEMEVLRAKITDLEDRSRRDNLGIDPPISSILSSEAPPPVTPVQDCYRP
ncbi:hypothetical protein NDU88_007049 [Pleurodeles waltl]|uniref:Uncharacterized protein n=1 Tax=Pleurodeles waltl TaxID=8319 RepID=A0AAV7SRL8_PLEWA|nr:hypothetical protein NDU88_007049 [Pleurodeles waltl]